MTLFNGVTQPVVEKTGLVGLVFEAITFAAAAGPSPIPTEPVQGPNYEVPAGHAVVCKVRTTQAGNPVVWVGTSAQGIKDGDHLSIQRGDYEPYLKLYVANLSLLWFAANTVGAIMELYIE